MQWSQTRLLRLWVGVALVAIPALLIVGSETYQLTTNLPELRRSQRLVDHTLEVLTTAQALERALQDAERVQRGYLITGDPEYLKPYQTEVKQASDSLSRLEQLTADNAEQQRRWPMLESRINAKLGELQRAIDARRDQGFEVARGIIESDLRANTMGAIGEIIDSAATTENALLRTREASTSAASFSATTFSIVAGGVALIIIVAGGGIFWQSYQRVSRSERALAESERRFRLLISGIEGYALYLLDPEGRIILWNSGAERMGGYKSKEILGRHFSRFYPPEDVLAGAPDEALKVAAANGSFTGEGWRVRKDGSRIWAKVLVSAIHDEQGNLQGFAKLTHDATREKEAELALAHETEERERAEAALRQAQKMEVLGRLTGGIAHDFNNMLAVIVGSLELLQRRLQTENPRLLDPINAALRAVERSVALTRGLLAFSRQQPLEPRPLDINRLVSGMSALLGRTLGERIEIETVLAAGLWTISADANQLENALLNLAINSRDAMPDGGKLTIETGNTSLDEAYASAHAEVVPGQYVMIAVSDTGSGMSEQTVEKAFEPFFSTKEPGQGTGLGLSQVYGLVKQSGGHIKIYSEVGSGTTIKMYFPRAYAVAANGQPQGATRPAPTQARPETIFVVEDNDLLLESVSATLREHGYRVLTASNGVEALERLEAEKSVDLLFTDVGLPGGVDGRRLAEAARRHRPGLIVLFTTGYTRNAIIHHGRLDPGVELITKPFSYAALVAKIERLFSARAGS